MRALVHAHRSPQVRPFARDAETIKNVVLHPTNRIVRRKEKGRGWVAKLILTRLGISASRRLVFRDVAQLGSAPEWGSGGRGFKSRRPD